MRQVITRRTPISVQRILAAALTVLTLLIPSCTVGPKYVKPTAPIPPAYKETGAPNVAQDWKQSQPSDDISRGAWWNVFGDRELSRLETQLNISNQNIVAAAANVQAARAMVREARAQYFPTVGVSPAITNNRISNAFGQTIGVTYNVFSLPFEASWEPDLWGRVRNTVRSNTFAAQASAADLENTRLSAQAELAADYFNLRAQDSLKMLYDDTVAAYQEELQLTRVLMSAGVDADEAVAQAEAQLKAAQAQDVNLGVLRAQYEHAIALLIGQPASEFSLSKGELASTPPRIPLGVPSELLERRPDIAAAERAMAQANAQIGIAQAAFYPNVTLGATAGLGSVAIAKWLAWPARIWSVGPSLTETIFDAGLRRATVQQYRATYDQTVANYRQTVLTAFQQVEDNLAALRVLHETIRDQESAIAASERSLEEAQVRYKSGLDPYLNVITAETAVLSNRQTQVNFESQQMVAAVQLIKALGGGWDVSRMPTEKEVAAPGSGSR